MYTDIPAVPCLHHTHLVTLYRTRATWRSGCRCGASTAAGAAAAQRKVCSVAVGGGGTEGPGREGWEGGGGGGQLRWVLCRAGATAPHPAHQVSK
jgi:hypothetical protein